MKSSWPTKWDVLTGVLLGGLVLAHYAVPPGFIWVHVVLFWLFQVPILIAAITKGVRGGLTAATIASATLLPHILGLNRNDGLSANALWMDLASLYILGFATGWLRDRWRNEEEMGERKRDLADLDRTLNALRQDLSGPLLTLRGQLIALRRIPGADSTLDSALRYMDGALISLETLNARLQILRIDSDITYLPLNDVLGRTQKYLQLRSSPSPAITFDWLSLPPILPASALSLSRALAGIILHMARPHSGVHINVSRSPGWAVLQLLPWSPVLDVQQLLEKPLADLEFACQVVRAHGGRVDDSRDEKGRRTVSIHIPTAARLLTSSGRAEGMELLEQVSDQAAPSRVSHTSVRSIPGVSQSRTPSSLTLERKAQP